ncbi:hypothetical protein [Enterococcus asini]|uniref:hypothetical protein n=1 Tax=Enterococcus asini TaxID=57732 RepID=UPI002890B443|nr:hypothetical protein [Enterococcus asini]MDT2743910.1 hypothetical protein [Enterococcus asini]
MDVMDELVIKEYFNLGRTIERLKNRRDSLHREFYQQSMTTHLEYTDLGIVSRGFRPDREVIKLYYCMALVERRIDRNIFRNKHFNTYLDSLPADELKRLKSRYTGLKRGYVSMDLLQKVATEIQEIETAICFREQLEPEPEQVTLSGDVLNDVATMAEVFAL